MDKNRRRSSSGISALCASSSTRVLKKSHESSRLKYRRAELAFIIGFAARLSSELDNDIIRLPENNLNMPASLFLSQTYDSLAQRRQAIVQNSMRLWLWCCQSVKCTGSLYPARHVTGIGRLHGANAARFEPEPVNAPRPHPLAQLAWPQGRPDDHQ